MYSDEVNFQAETTPTPREPARAGASQEPHPDPRTDLNGRIIAPNETSWHNAHHKENPGECDPDDDSCITVEDEVPVATPTDDDGAVAHPGPVLSTDRGPHNTLEYVFPAFGLKITLGDLELRILRDSDFPAYAALLREDIFQPEFADAIFPWADQEPDERIRAAFQYQWTVRASLTPGSWALPFGVFYRGTLIGSQEINTKEFELTRTVCTGSWLTRSQQGKGFGALMRQAVLAFAFDYLHAERAESDALETNLPSLATSRSLGYLDNGTSMELLSGKACLHQRLVLTPAYFRRPAQPIRVDGLTPELIEALGAG